MVVVRVHAYARARGLLSRMNRGVAQPACVYTAGFKRPNIFRALKLLTGVGVVGYSTLHKIVARWWL